MWARLSLLLALCSLPGGGAETEEDGPRCKQPPDWKIGEVEPMKEAMGQVTVVALLPANWLFCWGQASRLDALRQKLENQGLENVTYMVINHRGSQAQLLHPILQEKLSGNITLYQQEPHQPDVWRALDGEKNDFLIYDRCGRLTYHISNPYSAVEKGNIEAGIRETYCKHICGNCMHQSTGTSEECNIPVEVKPEEEDTGHSHGNGHGHHHGDRHGVGHGSRHGHHHGHGHGHHGDRGLGQGRGVSGEHGGQQQLDFAQLQQAIDMAQMPQEAQGAPVMQRPWVQGKARWKLKHSWQWRAGSENDAASKSSWCWHWRRLFSEAEGKQPAGLWHCDEALPASWQWQGLTGDTTNHVRETWQWRLPPADWQQPQPAQWAWPPGVESWAWQQPQSAQWAWPPGVESWAWQQL